jgi:hypothetical protein
VVQIRETRRSGRRAYLATSPLWGGIPTQAFEAPAPSGSLVSSGSEQLRPFGVSFSGLRNQRVPSQKVATCTARVLVLVVFWR